MKDDKEIKEIAKNSDLLKKKCMKKKNVRVKK